LAHRSAGTSMATGRGVPETSSSNAPWICRGAVGVADDRRVFGDLAQHGGWSSSSCSTRNPDRGAVSGSADDRQHARPRTARARQSSSGVEQAGPGTTHIAVGSPVACAAPIAMYAQPCS
jgi:hypothetical protein